MKKFNYKWTANEDLNAPNNNYNDEIQTTDETDAESFLHYLCNDGDLEIEHDEQATYYVLDGEGERTGEAYILLKEIFVSQIKQAREEMQMTRRELSDWLEIPYRTLEDWEMGKYKPTPWAEKLVLEKMRRRYSEKE